MADPLLAATPDTGPSEPSRPPRRAARIVLVVAAIVMVVVAIGAVAVGLSARSAADDDRAEAATLAHARRVQEQARIDAVHDTRTLDKDADALVTALDALGSAFDRSVDAQNRAVDEDDRAVDVYNAGNTAASEAIFRNEGAATLQELQASQDVLHTAQTAVHGARDQLEEDLR